MTGLVNDGGANVPTVEGGRLLPGAEDDPAPGLDLDVPVAISSPLGNDTEGALEAVLRNHGRPVPGGDPPILPSRFPV